jgi:hypothetical protein
LNTGPLSKINDGYNEIIIQPATEGRINLTKVLLDQDNGNYFNANGVIRPGLGITYMKTRAWRLDPLVKGPRPLEDNVSHSNDTQGMIHGIGATKIGGETDFPNTNIEGGGTTTAENTKRNSSNPRETEEKRQRKPSGQSNSTGLK